jgi:hypothetical protein
VVWFNNRRLLGPIGNMPPVERERAYHHQANVAPVMQEPPAQEDASTALDALTKGSQGGCRPPCSRCPCSKPRLD